MLALLIVITNLIYSCDAGKSREYNDKLVGIQKDIISNVEAIMKDSNEVASRSRAKDYIDIRLSALKKIKTVSGADSFKKAMIDDIAALQKVYDIAVRLDKHGIIADEEKKLTAQQKALLDKIGTYDEKVLDEQRKFAKAKVFRLEKNSEPVLVQRRFFKNRFLFI